MLLSSAQMDISHVTSAVECEKLTAAHKFQYRLNDEKTRKKLYEGAMKKSTKRVAST